MSGPVTACSPAQDTRDIRGLHRLDRTECSADQYLGVGTTTGAMLAVARLTGLTAQGSLAIPGSSGAYPATIDRARP